MTIHAVEAAIRARGVEWDIDPTLDRMAGLVDLLGNPQAAYPIIHIAGTNGKSSTARMVEALLKERNLRVGRYTSPEFASMRDRISLDGEPISEERFVEVYEELEPYFAIVDEKFGRLSFFEVLTAMAFAAFADAPVDVAVVETGMGGTWDATNVADGTVAVITPISLDHTEYLGNDVETIAGEKAGIIKPGSLVVAGPAAARGRRGGPPAGGRGRGHGGAGGHRVRGARARAGHGRAVAAPARAERHL